ncbi:TIGR02587 family membrane protein [Novosphingobium sp. M1R2S20]|uniref:TIGR02587 family membrane protein n=1 Tax=Novosphingobium rhizovicinum TaxID=3228928 RepID=A0ABV3REQ1_9SPHN
MHRRASSPAPSPPAQSNSDYAGGLARAFGGAVIFSLPMLMTMEMWFLGFYMDRFRLLLLFILNFVVLTGLSRFSGFEPTVRLVDDIMDALAAVAVGVIASAVVLGIFGILDAQMPFNEIFGKIVVQCVPASFGAMIARKQLAGAKDQETEDAAEAEAGYGGQLFLMMAGALFLAFNVAPTEEMILIGFKMTPWHSLALVMLSILLLHAFVFGVGFPGQEDTPEGTTFNARFFGYTVTGYAIALLTSLFVLWTFGRTDGAGLQQIATMTIVLGFPAAVGAAIARLVV